MNGDFKEFKWAMIAARNISWHWPMFGPFIGIGQNFSLFGPEIPKKLVEVKL